jgi:hypothetical protein
MNVIGANLDSSLRSSSGQFSNLHFVHHRGILRQTDCGSSRMQKNNGRNAHGTHTVRRPVDNARAVAAATCAGVLDNGAGSMPSVIRPITNPGRTINSRTPLPYSASESPLANPSRPALAEP